MSDKSTTKRTISPEQRAKMAEGRKKAMEERKKMKEQIKEEEKSAKQKQKQLEKEEKKQKSKVEKANKELEKKKELDLELQALAQQKDRIETLKKTMENRSKFRNKIKEFKEEEQESISGAIEKNIDMRIESPIEEESLSPETLSPEPLKETEEPDQEVLFKEEVNKIANSTKDVKSREIFTKLTNNYNKNMDISQNLTNMVANLKEMIRENTIAIKKATPTIEKLEQEKPIVEMTLQESKDDNRYKSQLSSLMRLR